MSVETITDYGAEPNPGDPDLAAATRNLEAVRDAADAAGPGGTVHVPEGEFYIGEDGSQLLTFGAREPRGISITGAGPTKSKLALSGNMPDNQSHTLLFYYGGDHGTVEIRDVELDGNAYNLPDLIAAGRNSRGPTLSSDDIDGGTWTFTNVLFSRFYASAVRLDSEEWTFDRCTFRECGIQARNDGGSGHAIEHHTPRGTRNVVKNCLFENIGSYAFNWRYGSGEVDMYNCYAEGTGSGLIKFSAGDALTVRNVYHRARTDFLVDAVDADGNSTDSNNDPFHGRHFINRVVSRSSVTPTLTLDNVVSVDHTFTAFKLRDDPIVLRGDLVALRNSCITNDEAVVQDEDTRIERVEIDRLSIHDTNGACFDTPDSEGSVASLRRANDAGGLGDVGGIVIDSDEVDADPYVPDVPARSDVGIDAEETTESVEPSPSRDPAVFETDFTDTSLDSFTPKWASGAGDWRISSTDSTFGGAVLELAPDSAGRHSLAWDTPGTATDVEVLTRTRVVADTDDFSDWCRSYVRGADAETAYFSALSDRSGFSLSQYENGSGDRLGSSTLPEVGTWYWTRLRVEGDTVGLRHWRDGDSEPDSWAVRTTDTDIASDGWIGVGGYPSDVQQFDYLGVGVGGASPSVPTPSVTQSSTGPSLFDVWTPRWSSSQNDWSATSVSSHDDDAVLKLAADSPGRHALSWDRVGTARDVDVLGLARVPRNEDSSSSWCRLYGRGAGTAGSETGYFSTFRDPFTFEIAKYHDGSSTLLASESIESPLGEWLFVRFNVTGDRLRARYWPYGETEPTTWNLDVTDTSIPDAGWAGVGGWSTDTQQWDYVSVATGGESAPFADTDRTPSVTWNAPAADATVSETVAVQLGADDFEDAGGSLAVDYRVDGGSWTAAQYSPETGYYEAAWDSAAVPDGAHLLEARATDAAGNTASDTVTVTAANDPVVEQFAVSSGSDSDWTQYDVDWTVADHGGDLDMVVTMLQYEGVTVAAESTRVSGGGASGTHSLRDRGGADAIRIVVNDTENRIRAETTEL